MESLVNAEQHLGSLVFLGRNILDAGEAENYRSEMEKAKIFLESLQAFNAAGKLKNFQQSAAQVTANRKGIETMREVESLYGFCNEVIASSAYLSQAETILPPPHPWLEDLNNERKELITDISDTAKRASTSFRRQVLSKLSEMKKKYAIIYSDLHTRERLNLANDNRKKELQHDARLTNLDALSAVGIMPTQQLREFKEKMANLQPCFNLMPAELDNSPICPHCSYRPGIEAAGASASQILDALPDELDKLVTEWTQTLLSNLEDPIAQDNIGLLKTLQKKIIADFIKTHQLPNNVNTDFVDAVNAALSDLARVQVTLEELKKALQEKSRCKDPGKIRIILE